MQLRTLAHHLRCLVGRNPLIRHSDRREARSLFVVLVVALIAAPVAYTAGNSVYDGRVAAFEVQRLSRHEIAATVAADSRPVTSGYSRYHFATVRWRVDAEERRAELQTTYPVKTGDSVSIWVDADGHHVQEPLGPKDATTQALVVGFGLWFAVACAGAASWVRLRRRLDRARDAEWARALEDLSDNGGRADHT